MRYYNIALTDGTTGKPVLPASLGGVGITSLLPNGKPNPAALNIEFDIPVVNTTPGNQNQAAMLCIYGLGLQAITSAIDLSPPNNTVNVKISAGMSKGLPLANPSQQGLIMSGRIFQAWGNWIGTEQTLNFWFTANGVGAGINDGVDNFPFVWLKGTQLKDALAQTLSTAYPGIKQNIAISPNLVLGNDEIGHYDSLTQLTDYVNSISKTIIGGTYQGVKIATIGDTVTAYDGTVAPQKSAIKKIAFQDMIGQPIWIGQGRIQVKFVLRGDLAVNDTINIPPSFATTSANSQLSFRDKSAQTGNFVVQTVQHFGNFRQSDAASWNTTVEAGTAPNA
jgi:hypothetical protein